MDGLWIAPVDTPTDVSLYRFQKTINVSLPARFTASICADTRYRLFVNDRYVCDGPCRGLRVERYYEQPDITPYLVEGKNTISVDVLYIRPSDRILISQLRGTEPALWFNGFIEKDGQKTHIYSDKTWKCEKINNIKYASQGFASMPPVEIVTGELTGTRLEVKRLYQPDFKLKNWTMWGTNERFLTTERTIPIIKPAKKQNFKVVKSGDNFIELDVGKYITAVPEFAFKGAKDGEVKFIYAECYFIQGDQKSIRDDSENGYIKGIQDTVTLTGKDQKFVPFWFRAFRFVRVEWSGTKNFALDLEKSGFCPYFYPLDETGSFECSNEKYNAMWEVSKNTVKCCTHEIIVDCPYYEQQQYGMDSCLEMTFLLRMSNDPRLGKKLIQNLASSQLDDGMLQANFPSTDYQVIPSFSLFWIMTMREYLRSTGDVEFIRKMTGTMDKVLEGCNSFVTKEGLFGRTNYWHYTDWVDTWHYGVPKGGLEEPVTVLSLIYATALGIAAELCRTTGRNGLAAEYEERKIKINQAVNMYCYDDKAKMYRNTPSRRDFSQHTAIWAILSDAITGEAAKNLMERVILSDRVDKCSFSMNFFVFRALEKTNLYKYAPEIMKGWEIMLDNHCTTWCENPGNCRSECHGWSSAPIYEFSAMLLGVFPIENGFKSVRIKPTTEGLDWAKGNVPTPYGDIYVEWKKSDGKLILDAQMPKEGNINVSVELEGKNILKTTDNTIHIEY